jgi:hypothetical protein
VCTRPDGRGTGHLRSKPVCAGCRGCGGFERVVLALGVWALASVAFAFYVAHFGSYDKTYGTLAGIIIFVVWLWISNVALLLGMEFNAERERSREVKDGILHALTTADLLNAVQARLDELDADPAAKRNAWKAIECARTIMQPPPGV